MSALPVTPIPADFWPLLMSLHEQLTRKVLLPAQKESLVTPSPLLMKRLPFPVQFGDMAAACSSGSVKLSRPHNIAQGCGISCVACPSTLVP